MHFVFLQLRVKLLVLQDQEILQNGVTDQLDLCQ